MSNTPKKFLDATGVQYLADKLNDYPTNVLLSTVINAIDSAKEDAMLIATQLPVSNVLQPNTIYALAEAVVSNTNLTIVNGSSPQDMFYLSFILANNSSIILSGNNLINAIPYITEVGYFYEIIGLWSPCLNKWILSTRKVGL